MRKQQGRYYFFYTYKLLNISYLDFASQKREPIKIAKKLLLGRVISRKVQRHKAFAESLRFSEQPALKLESPLGSKKNRDRRK